MVLRGPEPCLHTIHVVWTVQCYLSFSSTLHCRPVGFRLDAGQLIFPSPLPHEIKFVWWEERIHAVLHGTSSVWCTMTLPPLRYLGLTGQSAWQDLLRLLKEEAVSDIRGKTDAVTARKPRLLV